MFKTVSSLCAFSVSLAGHRKLDALQSSAFFVQNNGPVSRNMHSSAVPPRVVPASMPHVQTSMCASSSTQASPGAKGAGGVPSPQVARKWKLYVIPSSQFAAKAMVALDVQGIPYECIHVNPVSRKLRSKELPSGGFKVPEVEIPSMTSGEYTSVTESSAILHAMDDFRMNERPGLLYPSEDVEDADKHISSVINAYVLYFNHVSTDGWTRSIRTAITGLLPLGGILGKVLPLHAAYSSTRNAFKEEVKKTLKITSEDDVTDEKMTAGLISELERYEVALSGGEYLYGFSYPTAADVTLYAMVSRFTDGMGDGGLPASLPMLWDIAGTKLTRLQEWQSRMTSRYPLRWNRYKV